MTRNEEVMSGGLAVVDGDAERPRVVATTTATVAVLVIDRKRIEYPLSRLAPFEVPDNTLVDPRCGKWWPQRGERTSHCPKCHETFEGMTLFDAHQRLLASGSVDCLRASSMKWRGERLRLVEGTWRGPAMSGDVIKRVAS